VEDGEEHGAGEAAGVGVLERGVVAGNNAEAAGEGEFGAMGEDEGGA